MERREFVRMISLGLSGLAGLERLTKALAGGLSSGIVVCVASATSGYTECGADNNDVTCYGVEPYGPAFSCTGNYTCNSKFACEDYSCIQQGNGDFECKSTFNCAVNQSGSQFHCDGSDLIGYQFKCTTPFSCFPKGQGTETQRFYCDDFYCHEGQFNCYGRYGDCEGTYSA